MTQFEHYYYRVLLWCQLAAGFNLFAMQTLEKILANNANDSHALATRAHLHVMNQKNDAALLDYATLTQSGKATAADWFNQGYLFEQRKELEQARTSFQQALVIDERLDRAWYGLGLVLIQLRKSEEAIEALRKNTQLQPMSPHAWYQLARVHMDRQETEETLKIIQYLKGFEPKVAAQLERETGIVAN